MEKEKKIKIYLGLTYIVILSLFLWALFNKYALSEITSYDFIKNNTNYLIMLKENNFILTALFFLLLSIIWVLLLGFATPFMLAGGFIFGKWVGTIICILGFSLGSMFLYLLAIFFFREIIEEKFGKKFFSLKEKFKNNEFIYLVIYRIIGGIPIQIQNLLPVLFNVKIKNYFFGSLFGMAPQIFVWSSLGSGIGKIIDENVLAPSIKELILSPDIYIPIIGFIILLSTGIILKKYFFKN
tara:strand:- start:655 stop:1374 length:720 start_codon:yes stop_codon:yes gene_type:complete